MTSRRGDGEGIKFLRSHLNDADGPCLIWPLFRDPDSGYGHMGFEGHSHYAHRFMCVLANGPPPTPKHQATHSCGNGHLGCVHPKHLRWKTNQENQMDRETHGTWKKPGPLYKLTPEIVTEIRAIGDKESKTSLAKRFGTSRDSIAKILDGRAWSTPGEYSKSGFRRGDPRHPWRKEKTIAHYAVEHLKESGLDSIMTGDVMLTHEILTKAGQPHRGPNSNRFLMMALVRSPLFEKKLVSVPGKRAVRCLFVKPSSISVTPETKG